jgi:hypothetical protein
MEVTIDILPNSPSNVIYLRGSPGILPVAVLSTPDFDAASMVDRTSLTFGRTGDEHSLILCFKRGLDMNRDRNPDLFCLFRTRATGFQVGDTEGILKGKTLDGLAIEGRNEVVIQQSRRVPRH